jgi:hypothetical protein
MKKMLLVVAVLSLSPSAFSQAKVFVRGSHGYKYVSGVDRALPRMDAAGHDQTMELAKTFLQRCPDVIPTTNRKRADFIVNMNWTERTRYFVLGKLIHKPDQITVETQDGDILYSSVARSVGGVVEGACKTIQTAFKNPATSATASIPVLGVFTTERRTGGLKIVSVTEGGRAAFANLHVGDVISTIDNMKVNSGDELRTASLNAKEQMKIGYMFDTSAMG